MRHDVTLRQIHGFLSAAEFLSFSRAAEAMHITQSAFSQMIRELESSLGVRLFDRTTRRVALTEAGSLLHRKLRRGVTEIDDACRDAQAIARVEHGQVTVGSLASLAIGVVTQALGALRRAYPGIKVGLREDVNGALVQRCVDGEVDLAVCAQSEEGRDLLFEKLFDDELVAVFRSDDPLAQNKEASWAALTTVPFVLTVQQSNSREQVLGALASHGIRREVNFDVVNMFTALAMVREGFGVTFIPTLAVAQSNMLSLTWRRMPAPRPVRAIGIYRRLDRGMSPAAEKFVELLRQQVASLESEGVEAPAPTP